MKFIKISLVITLFINSRSTFSQSKTDTLQPANDFINFIGSFATMKYKSLEESKYQQHRIYIYKTTITTNKLFVQKSYALRMTDKLCKDKLSSLVSFVYENGRLLSIYGVMNVFKEDGTCDSAFVKKIETSNNVLFKTFENHSMCQFGYYVLQKSELEYLRDAVGDSLLHSTIWEYENCFYRTGILKNSPNAIKPVREVTSYGDPMLLVVKELAKKNNFQALRKLMYTKNKIFNWFVAEALSFYFNYGYSEAIGSWEDIQNYNGKGAYKEFRDYYRLRELYSLKGGWNE